MALNEEISGAGCDESLMSEIASGQSKRKAHGGVYFYKCNEGSVMQGSSVVVCNGRDWNDTAPICLSKYVVKVIYANWTNQALTFKLLVISFIINYFI